MKEILFSFLFFIPAFIGFGSFFIPKENYGNKGLLGMFIVSVVGLFLHFLIPLSWIVQFMIVLSGLILFVLFEGSRTLHSAKKYPWLILWLAGLIVYVWYFTYYATPAYDTGLYHLQTIKWIQKFALSPGLANLHGRFGFNSIWFILASITSTFTLNALLYFFIHISLFQNILSSKQIKNQIAPLVALAIIHIFQPIIAYFYVGFTVFSSPGNDYPVTLLILYVVYLLLDQLMSRENSKLNLILMTSFFAVLIKLSALPLLIVAGILFISQNKFKKNNVLPLFLIVVGLFWVLRGFYLSGCFIYPLQQTCVEKVSWAVPIQKVKAEAEAVVWWARAGIASESASPSKWYVGWVQHFLKNEFTREVMKYIFVSIALILFGMRYIKKQHNQRAFIIPFMLCLLGVAYWFISAPDIRFGAGYLMAIVFVFMSFGLLLFLNNSTTIDHKAVITLFMISLLVFFSMFFFTYRNDLMWVFRYGWKQTWPSFSHVSILQKRTAQGRIISVPQTGDQCFNVAIPCTPSYRFDSNLKMKEDGNRYYFWTKKQ